MSLDADVVRYLELVAELGGPELYLDTLERDEALSLAMTPRPARRRAIRPPAAGNEAARRLAVLTDLANRASTCQLCGLHAGRSTVVFGEGDPDADLVVVGEAPGQEEDRTGRPFVGRAGRLLDLLLMSVGFARSTVYICNVLKCRPPDNRNPQPDEIEACTTNYLHAQLAAVAPRAILAVGRFAVQSLLSTDQAIGRLRGRLHAYRGIPVVVGYHPAYLLRSPNMVRTAWSDFQLLRTVLDEQA